MRSLKIPAIIMLITVSSAAMAIAAQTDTTDTKGVASPVKPDKFTKEGMITYIKELLNHREDVVNTIPDLKEEKDAAGNVSYSYKSAKLEDMDKEDLHKLLNSIHNQMTRINAERLNKQMESIKQADTATRAAQQAARPTVVPVPPPPPPVTYTPPQPLRSITPPPVPPAPPKR